MATRLSHKPGKPRVTRLRWNNKVSMNHSGRADGQNGYGHFSMYVCVTPVTKEIRKQGKDFENASRRAGGARDIASLAPTKTLAMICDGDGSWDANSCTCCRFCNGNGQGQSPEHRKRQACSQAKGPFLGVETCTCVLQRAVCSGVARMTVMQMTR